MKELQLICPQCGSDRFISSAKSSKDVSVASILCEICLASVPVDDVVWYHEEHIAPEHQASEKNVSLNSAFSLIPKS